MSREKNTWWVGVVGIGVLMLSPRPAEARTESGSIWGSVTNTETGERIVDAVVVLQCTCLSGPRETTTNEKGLYAFRGLPTGTFTIEVLTGITNVSKVATLRPQGKFTANFTVNPDADFARVVKQEWASASRSAFVAETTHQDPFKRVTTPVPRREAPKKRLAAQRQALAQARPDAATQEASVVPTSTPAPELTSEAATAPLPKDFVRQVVYSGTMGLAVFNQSTAQTRVETLVRDAGGYVQSLKAEQMVVRIPALRFREVAQKIGELGRIDSQSFEALDVTEDYYDLRTRIEVLQRTHEQLLTLLDGARTVGEALEVRKALDAVTLELEAALGKQRLLSTRVEFSALSVSLRQRLPDVDTPSTNDPFPWVDDISVEGTAWR